MAEIVYFLCATLSFACAVQLTRSYLQTRSRLTLWCSLGFAGMALNNALLFFDLAILPSTIDLSLPRVAVSFASTLILALGLIWETTS